jgi:hypothetical protein
MTRQGERIFFVPLLFFGFFFLPELTTRPAHHHLVSLVALHYFPTWTLLFVGIFN